MTPPMTPASPPGATPPPPGTGILNVCALPDQRVADECVALSEQLSGEDTVLTLGGARFPHLTLFMARFPASAREAVHAAVTSALGGTTPPHCLATGFFLTAGGYAEVSYAHTAALVALHERLTVALAPLRASPGRPHVEGYFAPYTDEQRRNAEETGYDLALSLFRPHITLTRYREDAVPGELPPLPATASMGLSFSLTTVALYEADDNGAVHTELARWTLIPEHGSEEAPEPPLEHSPLSPHRRTAGPEQLPGPPLL